MARDLSEQEREFIEALAGDTGQGLDAWMQAIAASGHAGRNDIIDWLRQKGFAFSKASWLERIHHNGGRLIYGAHDMRAAGHERVQPASRSRAMADDHAGPAHLHATAAGSGSQSEVPNPSVETLAAPTAVPAREAATVTAGSLPRSAPDNEPNSVASPDPNTAPRTVPQIPPQIGPFDRPPHVHAENDADVAELLTAAKGLRPLAEMILREMDAVVPGLVRTVAAPFLMIASPAPFAALLPAPKDVRLFADFGPTTRDRTRKAESTRIAPPFPDCLVVNDARQIDDRFRELLATAYTRSLK